MSVLLQEIQKSIAQVVLGKDLQIKLALSCILAKGHLLIEDLPGVGKTTLAHTLAVILGLKFQRLQFTSDLLPTDLVGSNIYDREQGRFIFHPGPIFTQVLLADEINRASPKCQSALLEAMEERQVSVDGKTHPLPPPFFVIATQNPFHQIGTFPLPESQLDRFLMCLELGYPNADAERALLAGTDRRSLLSNLKSLLDGTQLSQLQILTSQVRCSEVLIQYLYNLINRSRSMSAIAEGLSPRAGLAILAAARAWAFIEGRDYVLPEDIKTVFPWVAGHRLRPQISPSTASSSLKGSGRNHGLGKELAKEILNLVAII